MKLLPLLLLLSTSAFASGGIGVRGGGLAVYANHQWTVREVFELDHPSGESFHLSPELRAVIADQVQPLVEFYSNTARGKIWRLILDPTADYRLVESVQDLHDRCGSLLTQELRDSESPYGCTKNGVTYFVASRFGQMTWLSQIAAILHERSHALDPQDNAHEWIEPFVRGTMAMLRLAIEQEEDHWRRLTPVEYTAIDQLMNQPPILDQLSIGGGIWSTTARFLYPNGGGIIFHEHELQQSDLAGDETSYLGIGSAFDISEHTCGPTDVEWIQQHHLLTDHSHVRNSHLECVQVVHSDVDQSVFKRLQDADRPPPLNSIISSIYFSRVKHVTSENRGYLLLSESELKNSRLETEGFQLIEFLKVRLDGIFLRVPEVREGFQIVNQTLHYETQTRVRLGEELQSQPIPDVEN